MKNCETIQTKKKKKTPQNEKVLRYLSNYAFLKITF